MRETSQDAIMERVDEQGNVLGFTVMAVSKLDKDHPLVAQLATAN
jgi:DNA-binding MltR family transcriptional regulator